MSQKKGYVDPQYLQAAAVLFGPIKRRTYELMQIHPGHIALDLGCGPGIDTTAIGRLVGPTGCVIGIDHDLHMLAEAKRRVARLGMESHVFHHQGDAATLALDTNCVDTCRSERLFEHLSNSNLTLTEMVRVTRPGGWIVVADMDWGTMSVHSHELDVERGLARIRAERMLLNGYAGRQLRGLFTQSGLIDVAVEMVPLHTTDYELAHYLGRLDKVEQGALDAKILDADDIHRWRSGLARAQQEETFFASVSLVIVAGRKP